MIGKTIAHFEVLDTLGEGGMGAVYRAKDTRLKRDVAIKLLASHLLNDEEAKQRFLTEARATSALNHPNVCTLYDILDLDGQYFLVMECLEGQTLRALLEDGPLEVVRAVHIINQIAAGLGAAHKKHIVHRDIKPSNIMVVNDDYVKIMDFGIARLVDGEPITKTGSVIGTLAYMSPEQLQGDVTDHRSDIWSLGVLFFEMLTGSKPFKAAYEAAIIYAILHEKAIDINELRDDIPLHISVVLSKSLDKSPLHRYQNVDAFSRDLNNFDASLKQGAPSRPVIVIIPFEDLDDDKEGAYFTEGLTEELRVDLSRIKNLKVIHRTTSLMLKDTDKDIKTIGRELDVDYVLRGSLRKSSTGLRITTELIDARIDNSVWAQRYKGSVDDIFDIQEKIAHAITDVLEIHLSPEEEKKLGQRTIDNVLAYDSFIRARHEFFRWTKEALDRAIGFLEHAFSIVGPNEYIYTGLAFIYFQYVNAGIDVREENIDKTLEYAEKIFALNPNSHNGHRTLGFVQYKRRDIQGAVNHTKKALALEPEDPDNNGFLAYMYLNAGQLDAAFPVVLKMLKSDPLNPLSHWMSAWYHLLGNRLGLALDDFQKANALDPFNPIFRLFLAQNLGYHRRLEEASEVVDMMLKDTPDTLITDLGLFLKWAMLGEKEKALECVTDRMLINAKWDEHHSLFMAEGYSLIGELDASLKWLERVVDVGFYCHPFLSQHDPFLMNVRSTPQFEDLIQRVEYYWKNFSP